MRARHEARHQSAPSMGCEYANPGNAAAAQRASRNRHLITEDAGGGDDLRALEKRQRAVELGDVPRDRQFLIGWKRCAKGAPHHRRVRPLLLRPNRPELQTRGCAYRWTSARARQGLPEPLTSFSGATTMTQPARGSLARFASCVKPYLFAPSRN